MEIYIRSGTELLATYRDGTLYMAPGISRELVAFELFRALNRALADGDTLVPQVTWGHTYSLAANQGGP